MILQMCCHSVPVLSCLCAQKELRMNSRTLSLPYVLLSWQGWLNEFTPQRGGEGEAIGNVAILKCGWLLRGFCS